MQKELRKIDSQLMLGWHLVSQLSAYAKEFTNISLWFLKTIYLILKKGNSKNEIIKSEA